jgi:SAM-dependent methyltransferase
LRELAEPLSFRDPDGYVFKAGDRILRYVLPHAAGDVRAFLESPLAANWTSAGKLVHSRILENPSQPDLPPECSGRLPQGAIIVEHDPVSFPNYPYEWTPGMLQSAAELTLELAREAMRAGFTLKDATPYNLIFDGGRPVFVDLLSIRRRDPTEAVWQPYAQFVRTFILPLIAFRYFGLRPDEILLAHRDGIEPERLLPLCPAYRLLLPPFLSTVTLPVLLARAGRGGTADRYRVRHARDADEAAFLLESLFARAGRLLRRTGKPPRNSATSQYMNSGHPYAATEFAGKERFVERAMERHLPRRVLDVGCNTGHFSRLAARTGARVVAIDRDEGAVDALWRSASHSARGILPLVVDIGRPPGACGWQNGECAAFLDRARGSFDCVLMLALLHHLVVNERVPLAAILQLAADLTTRWAVVEYIDPRDPNFQHIARGRDALHRDLTQENFESAAGRWFQIADAAAIGDTRRIYLLRKKGA